MIDFLSVTWNVDPVIFKIGPLTLRWYSLLFVAGFPLGYWLFDKFYKREGVDTKLLEPLLYAGTSDERRFRYVCAKHEVRSWMDAHGQAGLLALLDALASGEPFETAYGMTDPE